MSNFVFPQFIGQTLEVKRTGPIYDVNKKISGSGLESRINRWALPRFKWSISIAFLRNSKTISILDNTGVTQFTGTEIDALLWFIDQHKTDWDSFLFNDPYAIQRGTSLTVPLLSSCTLGAGTLPTGTYWYRVSALSGTGETAQSLEVSFGITGPAGVTVNWSAVTGATGYKIYGRNQNGELFIASVGAGVTSYNDNGSITPYGFMPQWRARFDMDEVDLDQVMGISGMWSVKTLKLISVK